MTERQHNQDWETTRTERQLVLRDNITRTERQHNQDWETTQPGLRDNTTRTKRQHNHDWETTQPRLRDNTTTTERHVVIPPAASAHRREAGLLSRSACWLSLWPMASGLEKKDCSPKSVTFRLKRLSTTQLVERSRPWQLTGEWCKNFIACRHHTESPHINITRTHKLITQNITQNHTTSTSHLHTITPHRTSHLHIKTSHRTSHITTLYQHHTYTTTHLTEPHLIKITRTQQHITQNTTHTQQHISQNHISSR